MTFVLSSDLIAKDPQKRRSGLGPGCVDPSCAPILSAVAAARCRRRVSYVPSATKVFHNYLCVQKSWRMRRAFLRGLVGLSQGLVGRARWSGCPPPLQQEIKHRG